MRRSCLWTSQQTKRWEWLLATRNALSPSVCGLFTICSSSIFSSEEGRRSSVVENGSRLQGAHAFTRSHVTENMMACWSESYICWTLWSEPQRAVREARLSRDEVERGGSMPVENTRSWFALSTLVPRRSTLWSVTPEAAAGKDEVQQKLRSNLRPALF